MLWKARQFQRFADTTLARAGCTILLTLLVAVAGVRDARGDVSLGAWIQHSPDDITVANYPGLLTLTGNDATANVTLPFTFVIEGTNYTTLTISTNGWIEFGGNTQGTSDPANACLPTSKHTNPFLAAYWDDLQTFGTNIRYVTVGTSPNRTFIVDYQVDVDPANEGGSADDMAFQVQVHETSNLINVRYRGTGSTACGQAATIGFQGAGGTSAASSPLTCNGKVLDDNQPDEGWSVDVGRAGKVTMSALMASSPDDISGFTTLSGNDATASPVMPFSVTIDGVNYSTVAISTNGWMEFGGNTQGTSDPSNDCLPTAKHTNPFLAVYWDDVQTQGTNIRYGTVGTSPNRTFIADFVFDVVAQGGSDVMGVQVQVHETSNLINVKYREADANADGQAATIGFQRAGGASATAYPLTCNGKVLDDNRPPEGWSIHPTTQGISLHAAMESSPDDLSGVLGLLSLSGDNATAGVTLPFSVKVDGTSYSSLTIGTNGTIQFGTTSGANPTINGSLPSSSFPNPTLFWYWDDLVPEGSNIQYGTVGTSPNRTFIVDFQCNLLADSSQKVNGQVEIHERSNLMNVKYRDTLSPNANGQSATLGFQGAGGAAAKAYPLTFNGKVLDDNLPNAGWSVAPLPGCGNGIIEGSEQCDEGTANGTSTSCCTNSCTLVSSGTTCRTSGADCYVANTCSGANGACPSTLKSAGSTCTDESNPCTVDQCTGGATAFVGFTAATGGSNENHFINSWALTTGSLQTISYPNFSSVAGLNLVGNAAQAGSQLQLTANVNGQVGAAWFTTPQAIESGFDTTFQFQITNAGADGFAFVVQNVGASTIGGGGNDLGYGGITNSLAVEFDTHDSSGEFTIPHVSVQTLGRLANAAADSYSLGHVTYAAMTNGAVHAVRITYTPGTLNVYLDGAGSPSLSVATNLADIGLSGAVSCQHTAGNAGALCRASAGDCDPAETCTGTSSTCPADLRTEFGTLCSPDGNPCTLDFCDGTGVVCTHPAGGAGITCRNSTGECDPAEVCTGTSTTCPGDTRSPGGTACTADSNPCTLDQCDGSSAACQHPAGNTGVVCRASTGECDPAEQCTGTSTACPGDARSPGGTACTADSNPCTLDQCDGSSAACQHPAGNAGAVCRAVAGECDVAESCTGTGAACPADGKKTNGTACTDDGNACTADECNGSSALCQHPPANGGTICRAAAGPCDVAETLTCVGTTETCPADTFVASGTACAEDGNPCTLDQCDGSSAACQHPVGHAGTVCHASTGDCDPAETCTGSSAVCPNDVLSSNGTSCPSDGNPCTLDVCDGSSVDCQHPVGNAGAVCRSSAGPCDVEETCSGSSVTCPADLLATVGTECRGSTGECDPAEACTGTDAACPADALVPSGTACTADVNPCTRDECDGTHGACQHPAGNGGAVCRASAGGCDPAETCTGTNTACPADTLTPGGTECRASAGVCDPAETCTGTSAACPADAKSTALCRAAAGQCDAADFCDGVNNDCPADGALPNGTSCNSGDGCPADTCQAGVCQAVSCPNHDTVVLLVGPKTISIPVGIAFVNKTLKVRVRNADVGETAGHTVSLSVDDSDCGGNVASLPDFNTRTPAAETTITVPGGKTKTAKIVLTIRAGDFSGSNPKAPSRCTLVLTATAVVAGGSNDPQVSNNVLPVELNVIDKNDPLVTAVHETAVKSLKPTVLTIKVGKPSVVKKAVPSLVNADANEPLGDVLQATASDGTCPPGIVGVIDHNGSATGVQSSATVKGGATKAVGLPLTATTSVSTPNKLSPQRCVAGVTVAGPGGDTVGTNNSTHLVIDMLDKNDF